jgi:aspartyl-tRNA(Asn)/glutamyl-tRNA(Gln) amidotransferase subunit A
MTDIHRLGALALSDLYRQGTLSPVEAARATIERSRRVDLTLNAFVLLDEKAALDQARRSEARWRRGAPLGLLDGVPISIKDLLLTRGWPTLSGSQAVVSEQAWNDDAPCLAALAFERASGWADRLAPG